MLKFTKRSQNSKKLTYWFKNGICADDITILKWQIQSMHKQPLPEGFIKELNTLEFELGRVYYHEVDNI